LDLACSLKLTYSLPFAFGFQLAFCLSALCLLHLPFAFWYLPLGFRLSALGFGFGLQLEAYSLPFAFCL